MIVSQSQFLKGSKPTLVLPSSSNFGALPANNQSQESGFLSNVKNDLSKRVDTVKNFSSNPDNKFGAPATIGVGIGQAIGAVGDVLGEGAKSIYGKLPQGVQDVVGPAVKKSFASALVDTVIPGAKTIPEPLKDFIGGKLKPQALQALQGGVEKYEAFKKKNPVAATEFESALSILSAVPIGKGAKVAGEEAIGLAKATGEVIGSSAKKVGTSIAESQAAKLPMAIGTKIGEGVSSIPRRIGANLEASQVEQAAIKSLPTKVAQVAAKDGVDPNDLKFIYSVPKSEKAPLKKLFDIAERFSGDKTSPNPIQAVGNSITKRVKELDSVRLGIGKRLGDVSNKLGVVLKEDITPKVFENLKKVPGLNGLKMNTKGGLIFKDTSLATELSKADRTAINKAFSAATKTSNGKQKHLLRQELFEILGGKKRSLQQLTDTQEKAFEAIRKGLSDVLETKNIKYKTLSNEYRQAIQPLQEMRKFMKNVAGANEDILDMKGGLLARRLTSNVGSNPEIRNLLETMDKILKLNKRKVPISTKRLQDFYNILDKHFDIAGPTTFQGQVQRGVEKASGIKEAVMETARSFAGKTDEVTRKALKQAIEEALK